MKTFNIVLGVGGLVVGGIVVAVLVASRAHLFVERSGGRAWVVTPRPIVVREIPRVFDQLRAGGKETSWAAFAFNPAGEQPSDENSVNLQFSIENGVIGLDWVLLTPRNRADKDRVATFIKQRNHTIVAKETKLGRYLRVEDGNLAELGVQIVGEFYGLGCDGEMDMYTDKFEWRPER